MKEVVIKDIKRKTNLDRKVLREAAILGYSTLVEERFVDVLKVEEESSDYGVIIKTDVSAIDKNPTVAVENYIAEKRKLFEKEQKRWLQKEVDHILNSITASVENFYSRSQVKKDEEKISNVSVKPSTESL